MYDIPELEKKWRKYKRNQIKRPLIASIVTLLLVTGVTVVAVTYLGDSSQEETTKVASPAKTVPAKEEKAIVITKTSATATKQAEATEKNPLISAKSTVNTTAQPSQGSIDLSKATIVEPNLPKDDIRVIGFDNKGKKSQQNGYSDIVIPKKSVQDIQEQEKIAEVEDRFKATQDPKDSLYIAKYYYKKAQYKKAENWAVNTNNIDGDIEESWLIFAKARAKQGFRVDAIKVLQSYYDETNSQKAKTLLDKLRFGKNIK